MPTALELTREEREQYIEAARRRPFKSGLTPAEMEERQRLLFRLSEVAQALKSQLGIQRVVVFGSLAHAAWFSPDSDIDLAVEATADQYWQGWKLAEDMLPKRCLDFVAMDMVSGSLRQAIEQEGIEL
jgi:uncharacterized protein